ncbi:L-asparaginase-like isoform X2 [Babylonia areolata]|uniref:L-asparaginase-like isoform X2 n=1 Tax=Babylonia areolata TaxID=304850 RepID=UPI003FD3149A
MSVEMDQEHVQAMRQLSQKMDAHAVRQALSVDSVPEESVARVLVLYTGGTIGMVVMDKDGGYAPKPHSMVPKLRSLPLFHDDNVAKKIMTPEEQERFLVLPEDHLDEIRVAAKQKYYIMYEVVEFDPLLDSSNMNREDWIKIARCIESSYEEFDGFVVLHGTDTMAYTASALSFMCEHQGKPIILTGAQIPIYEVRSDGRDNFISSLIIAGGYNIPEVMLCFNEKVFRGNRTIKYDSSSFTAFTSPNMPPLVSMDIDIHVDWPAVFRCGDTEKFCVHTNLCSNVGILRLFPGITTDTVKAFLQPPMQGVVLQTYGSGNAPSNRADLMTLIHEATKWGVLIVNITQCSRGNVSAAYATGVALENAGVIPGGDMTPEAALCKLSYVLGKAGWTMEMRKKMLARNIRGEMTVHVHDTSSIMDHDLIEGVARTLSLSTRAEVGSLKDALYPNLLCAAAKAKDIPAIEKLLSSGADVSAVNQDGRTALHVACSLGNLNIVSFLLGKGASVHLKDNRGDNPLIDAVLSKTIPVINILVQTGARLPWKSIRIAVSLCCAAATDDLETIRAWHAAGADMNSADYDSRTALHIAVTCNRKEIVKYLLASGAICLAQDIFGMSPLSVAQKLGHTDLVKIMCPHGPAPEQATLPNSEEPAAVE